MSNNSSDQCRRLIKQRINKGNNDSRDTYGDMLSKSKETGITRFMFQNINGLGTTEKSNKREYLREFIDYYNINIMALAEVNINWRIVGKKSLYTLSKKWFENSRVVTSNKVITSTKRNHQQGGVTIMSAGDLALKVQPTEVDKKQLGRWCSMKYRGEQGCVTQIVSVYFPCLSKTHGNKTVYCQQQAGLLHLKTTKSVEEAFWSDFWKDIDQWLQQGKNLIIGGDWNTIIHSSPLVETFASRNIFPVITGQHDGPAPATYNNGSYPIDEIFATPGCKIKSCGYLDHGENCSNHQPLWIDFYTESLLGSNPPPVMNIKARRLKTNDPRIVDKYNTVLEEEFEKFDVYTRALELYNECSDTSTATQCAEYKLLDAIQTKAMKKAERKCQRLKMGAVPWSPAIKRACKLIQYIKL